MLGLINALDKFNGLATRYAAYLATLFLAAMTAIVTVHVITRYGFGHSFEWTEEVSRGLMVWMAFLLFPMGHKRGMNIAVEFAVTPWVHTLPGRLLKIALEILAIVVLVTCFQLSLGFVERGMGSSSQALQWTMGYIYMVVPFCFGLTLLCAVENLLRLTAKLCGMNVPDPIHVAAARAD